MKVNKIVFTLLLLMSTCMLVSCQSDLTKDEAEKLIQEEYAILLDNMDTNPLIIMLHEGFEVSVSSVRQKDEQYMIKCLLQNFDAYSVMKDMMKISTEMSIDEYEKSMNDKMKMYEKVSTEAELLVTKDQKGNYVVTFSEDQLDFALGRLLTFYNEIMGQEDAE